MIYADKVLSSTLFRIVDIVPQTFPSLYGTPLGFMVLRYYNMWISNISSQQFKGNRVLYKLHLLAYSDTSSFDISTCKLWYAMALLMKADYTACLRTVNNVLSRIPPFALYMSGYIIQSSDESKSLYGQIHKDSDNDFMDRASTSWLMDLRFTKDMLGMVPSAIHIELSFCDPDIGVDVSPFTFAYYLMFLCYHELRQYGDRNRALRLLLDVVNNPEQHGVPHHSFNIAGHCLY